ncbi:hypothetical protein GWG54_05650 [Natronococcus sp. JC468]|uniref:hypothetical protein n=1 Tax=Natronococcus sp. JC468 TaxID=1961921 RepID=UPI00143C3CE8|nr:hypothetical protein [Natronococcus sp. JC468]NKE35306.1 hypothetical protein [Natronococcus sp. JC468]
MTRLTRLAELRRLLPLTAAGLFLLALTVPVWRITFDAPQYVETLVVELYAHPRIGGDFEEVAMLNKYVGFYYPDPVYADPNYAVHEKAVAVPEWILGPVAFVGLAATAAVVALLPGGRIERGLLALFTGAVAVLGSMAVIIQYRLYQAGHTLDPDAPLNGVDGFTPPLLGNYQVANIDGTAWVGPGGYMLVAAVVALAVAVALRDSPATIADVPALARNGWNRFRDRVRRRGREDDRSRGNRPSDSDERPGLDVETDGGSDPRAPDARGSDGRGPPTGGGRS